MSNFKYFIFSCLIAVFASCNWQRATPQTEKEPNSIGTHVAKLDPGAMMVFQDSKNSYWFVSKDKGIYRYENKKLVLFTLNNGLCSYSILNIQEDHLGNLYFDTPDCVCKYDGQKFTVLPIAKEKQSKTEWKSKPNDLWFRIGWDKKGPYRFDGEKLHHVPFPKSKIEDEFYQKHPNISYNPYSIFSMYKDSQGAIWFGTADMGIFRFDGEQISWMHERHLTETPEGGAFGIRSIVEDGDGYFWICNTKYKYRILSNSKGKTESVSINYEREKGIENFESSQYFMSMLLDNSGDLWITNQSGIWRNDGKELTPFFIKESGKSISPTAIYKDRQGLLWFSTNASGIYQYDGSSTKKFKIGY